MKHSILILIIFTTITETLIAQNVEPSKNKFGAVLSTDIFGFNDGFNKVDIGGGFYFSREITKKISIYYEMYGSSRNYGNLAITAGQTGEFTTGNLAIFFGPTFNIGKKSNLISGLAQNHLFRSYLNTTIGKNDVTNEVTNYTSSFFDFRHHFGHKLSIGIRYECGINSIFKNSDSRVSSISFNMFLPFGEKRDINK